MNPPNKMAGFKSLRLFKITMYFLCVSQYCTFTWRYFVFCYFYLTEEEKSEETRTRTGWNWVGSERQPSENVLTGVCLMLILTSRKHLLLITLQLS